MNKIILAIIGSLIAGVGNAQNSGVGIHFGANDFYGPQTKKYLTDKVYSVSNNLETGNYDTTTKNTFRWHPLVRFTYWRNVGSHFDVNLGLSLGNVDYPVSSTDSNYIIRRQYGATKFIKLLAELDARVNYNIISKENHAIAPYVFAGISGALHPIYFGATIPIGAGLNINLTKRHDVYFNLESAYKIAATSHDQNHLQHSVGFVYWYKPHYSTPKPEEIKIADAIAQIKDTDGDGIEDAVDKCPTIPGLAQFDGCPDTDGDGIGDSEDACPLVAGLAQFGGCPDSDGDGIPDNKDKCPYAAGTPDRLGCPIPDRDHDGFADDIDQCPDAYSLTNHGCPEVNKEIIKQVENAAKAIFFETGKDKIKPISFKSLDAVVNILKTDASLFADVEGHTDNVSPKTYTNLDLSQRRADAVKAYLVNKGIAANRLTAQGFGDTHPIADNNTTVGRAANRRTVIMVRNFSK